MLLKCTYLGGYWEQRPVASGAGSLSRTRSDLGSLLRTGSRSHVDFDLRQSRLAEGEQSRAVQFSYVIRDGHSLVTATFTRAITSRARINTFIPALHLNLGIPSH